MIHLLATTGTRLACSDDVEMVEHTTDINFVDCPHCINIHDAYVDYISGMQKVNQHGDRIWLVTDRLVWPAEPHTNNPRMWECKTAEGPEILAIREFDGTARLQVQDGKSPERTDACAETFVSMMEYDDFCMGWGLLANKIKEGR